MGYIITDPATPVITRLLQGRSLLQQGLSVAHQTEQKEGSKEQIDNRNYLLLKTGLFFLCLSHGEGLRKKFEGRSGKGIMRFLLGLFDSRSHGPAWECGQDDGASNLSFHAGGKRACETPAVGTQNNWTIIFSISIS